MRVGKVIGRLTLSQTYETLVGGRFLVVAVQDRFSLAGKPRKSTEDHFQCACDIWFVGACECAHEQIVFDCHERENAAPFRHHGYTGFDQISRFFSINALAVVVDLTGFDLAKPGDGPQD